MNCNKIKDYYLLYVDNKLTPQEKAGFESHIQQCKNCTELLSDYTQIAQTLSKLEKAPLPEGYYETLGLRLDKAEAERHSRFALFLDSLLRKFNINNLSCPKAVIGHPEVKQTETTGFPPKSYGNDSAQIRHSERSEESIWKTLIPALCVLCIAIGLGVYLKKDTPVRQSHLSLQISAKAPDLVASAPSLSAKPTGAKEVSVKVRPGKGADTAEAREIITLAKAAPPHGNKLVFRGTDKTIGKKILKQWQDVNSGITVKKSLIIENESDWNNLWNEHISSMQPKPALPEVDFVKNVVVAVFMGRQKTSGYGVLITKVEDSGAELYIEITETAPSPNAAVAQELTQPYHIVVIDK